MTILHRVDVDECARGIDECSINALCTDTVGSYYCTCDIGYDGNGFNCTSKLLTYIFMYLNTLSVTLSISPDIDECAIDTHNCDENANCTDTDGSFQCACLSGYEGNGTFCQSAIMALQFTQCGY